MRYFKLGLSSGKDVIESEINATIDILSMLFCSATEDVFLIFEVLVTGMKPKKNESFSLKLIIPEGKYLIKVENKDTRTM